MIVRPAEINDACALSEIYNHYVLNSHVTFEIAPIKVEEMEKRISAVIDQGYPFLVAEANGSVIGCAFAHEYRARTAYRSTVEVSVYIGPGFQRQGVGRMLYRDLFERIAHGGYHAIVAGIALPNDASVRLHEEFGMQKVAHFREVGRKFDRWIDVGYWELLL